MKTLLSTLILAFALLGCATMGAAGERTPLPYDLEIVPPTTGVPGNEAAFSGKWFGVWDNILDHTLVVEEIDENGAIVIYSYGKASQWNIRKGGWTRVRGHIKGDTLTIKLRRPATVIYKMRSPDSLKGTYEWSGGISRITMKRVKE